MQSVFALMLLGSILAGALPAMGAESPLTGSEWGLGVSDAPFVQFRAKGRISGNGGCNRFFGRYATNEKIVALVPVAVTRKFCGERVMKLEREFLTWLGHARSFEFTHQSLRLLDGRGRELVKLKRRDFD